MPLPSDPATFVGLYGVDTPVLDIYEEDGALFAEGCGLHHAPAGALVDREGAAAVALIAGRRLIRQDFAALAGERFRQAIAADLSALRARSLEAEPPPGTSRSMAGMADIRAVDPGIAIDMRYATDNNFIGAPLYDCAAAFLQSDAAAALAGANAALLAQGYRLVVLDAYRPWSVTWLFWEAVPVALRHFCADPAAGSKHNRGCAADVTLADAATGRLIDMPSGFDEPTQRAAPDYRGSTSQARRHRDLLRREMEAVGFTVDPHEWWHYDFAGWEAHPVRNAPLGDLG